MNDLCQKETQLFPAVCRIQRLVGSQETKIVVYNGIGQKIHGEGLMFAQMGNFRVKDGFHLRENCGCNEFPDKIRLGHGHDPPIKQPVTIQQLQTVEDPFREFQIGRSHGEK